MLEVLLSLIFLALGFPCESAYAASQNPILGAPDQTAGQKHIAVIGAGVGGAATAYDLYEQSRHPWSNPRLRITIFEREAVVGGRIQSVPLDPSASAKIIENGAAYFFTDDWCLTTAAQNVGLKLSGPSQYPPGTLKPDPRRSDQTYIKCNAESTSWQDFLLGRWKYGSSWSSFHTAVQSVLEKWHEFAGPHKYPFDTITEEFKWTGIPTSVYGSAGAYFNNLSISSALQHEFVQPCTRVRLSQNLEEVSAIATLLAAGKAGTTSVEGGNGRLVERLIRLSEADLQLNSTVTAISPGSSRRYRLSVSHTATETLSAADDLEFDMVILATPLETSRIDLGGLNVHSTTSPNPRIDTHVTHFSSSVAVTSNLSSFPLEVNILDQWAPTASTMIDDPNILSLEQSDICMIRCPPDWECDVCNDDWMLYRVVSREALEDDDLIRMLGRIPGEGKELSDYGIRVVQRQAWPKSHPVASKGHLGFVEDIEMAPSLYYLNGAETVLSSMEMSCRMGRHAALRAEVKWSPLSL